MTSLARLGAVGLALVLGAHPSFAKDGPGPKKEIAKGAGVAVTLDGGREVKGVYLGRHDDAVWIGVDGGEVGLEPATILKITPSENEDSEFLKRKAALPPNDAAARWELARWARDKKLTASAQSAAESVVSIQPEHAEARAFLGHEKIKGQWLDFAEAKRARGFVEFEGDWLTPAEILRIEDGRRRDAETAASLEQIRRGKKAVKRAVKKSPSSSYYYQDSGSPQSGYTEVYRYHPRIRIPRSSQSPTSGTTSPIIPQSYFDKRN